MMILQNLEHLKTTFGERDPVIMIVESIGDVTDLFKKIKKTPNRRFKVNLTLPTRWLLRERGMRSCPKCTMPMTYSLIIEKPGPEYFDIPTTVPVAWFCLSCGNSQEGWHMKCSQCNATRRDFPSEALFKCFKQTYSGPFLELFIEIIYELPPIPPKLGPLNYMKNYIERDKSHSNMVSRIKTLLSHINESPTGEDIIKDWENKAIAEY